MRPTAWRIFTPSNKFAESDLTGQRPARAAVLVRKISAGKTISNALGGALVAEVKLAVGGTALFDRWNPASGNLYVEHGRPREPIGRRLESCRDTPDMWPASSGCREKARLRYEFRDDYATNLRNFIAGVRR